MYSSILALSLVSAVIAAPTPDDIPSHYKNTLVPDGNGKLVFASVHQIRARMLADEVYTVSKRADCNSPTSAKNMATCEVYCEKSVTDIEGERKKVSADVDCTTATCGIAKAEATTITQSFTINLGGTSGAGETGVATLTAGVSYSWSKAEATTDTYTFNPVKGDKGYIVFHPYMKKSCGTLVKYSKGTNGSLTSPRSECIKPEKGRDNNACGASPKKTSSGKADGRFAFCNMNTNEGC